MSRRPDHLPDFAEPPLDEVVLGVQFEPVSGYSAVYAKDIWELFRSEFPKVQEQPILPHSLKLSAEQTLRPALKFIWERHLSAAGCGFCPRMKATFCNFNQTFSSRTGGSDPTCYHIPGLKKSRRLLRII